LNLRTLKKLSKRAAPLLPLLGDDRQQFKADGDSDGYISTYISARKHWDRGRSVHARLVFDREIKTLAARGYGWIYMKPPAMAWKGTMMVGGMSGYYEPEWDEESAWCALSKLLHWTFMDFPDDGEGDPIPTRRLLTPSDYFRAAEELIAAQRS